MGLRASRTSDRPNNEGKLSRIEIVLLRAAIRFVIFIKPTSSVKNKQTEEMCPDFGPSSPALRLSTAPPPEPRLCAPRTTPPPEPRLCARRTTPPPEPRLCARRTAPPPERTRLRASVQRADAVDFHHVCRSAAKGGDASGDDDQIFVLCPVVFLKHLLDHCE